METFKHKKQYGQNFLSDKNLLRAIVSDAGITQDDSVLEIGAGKGSLTSELCSVAKSVVSFEIDETLKPYLDEVASNNKNLKIIFDDIMNYKDNKLNEIISGEYKVVANLPYYITTPILFMLLEHCENIKSITVMVQKEVAERIISVPNKKEYGILSIMCQYYADVKIKRIVGKQMFNPVPKIDSAILHFAIKDNINNAEAEELHTLVRQAFSMRRKTLYNNINKIVTKDEFRELVKKIDKDETVRAENLSLNDYLTVLKVIRQK